MINKTFFKKNLKELTIKKVIEITGSELANKTQTNLSKKIKSVATLMDAGKDEISFFTNAKYIKQFEESKAGFCFTSAKYADRAPKGMVVLLHKNPYFAYTKLITELFTVPSLEVKEDIAKTAFVNKTAKIGKGTEICHGAYIGENVKIGSNCKIGVNAVINHDCEIGDNCIIENQVSISYSIIGNNVAILNGARIGQRGFGFVHNEGFNHRIPQLGIVRIGNHVEIGANTCIDRGALEDTEIGNNSKLDNLLQIAHGVKIGQGCFFAGATVVAGSTKIGNFVQVGGNSSITGHIEIGDGAQIAGHSGVAQPVKPMQAVAGYPNLPIRDWHRINVKLKQMIKKGV